MNKTGIDLKSDLERLGGRVHFVNWFQVEDIINKYRSELEDEAIIKPSYPIFDHQVAAVKEVMKRLAENFK